jgi:predicted enzyme related to lactoylglutathione lyase
VDDVDKTYAELQAKGIRFVMPPTQREGEGIKLAVAIDPDGLPISFAQLMAHGAGK